MGINDRNDIGEDLSNFIRDFKNNFKFTGNLLLAVFVVILGVTSFYTVEPNEEAVVIRLGKYVGTYPPGLHFKIPLGIDKIIKVKTTMVNQMEFGFRTGRSQSKQRFYGYAQENVSLDSESLMLTGDLNVADVKWIVQYRISDPFKFLFKTSSPERNIRDVSESIMRRVVGDRSVTEVLTTGRVAIGTDAKIWLQDVLNKYDMGAQIVSVKLQDVNPPERVKASFNEVNEAKQEQEKAINQAEEAYNKVIPEAKGKAEKLISEAQGFAKAIINRAHGDAAKFKAVVREYKLAPKVTRKRIYLETMEEIFSKFEDITIVDSKVQGLLPIFNGSNHSLKVER